MIGRFQFIALTVLIGFASLPAAAQSGRTFYIDYAIGSNTNNGTAKSIPWKTHPYMQTSSACTGTGSAPAYSHQAGDRFIFKGGVSWPPACFGMYLPTGGTASAVDYYGVDITWFAGTSFTRPLFDFNFQVPTITGTNGEPDVIQVSQPYVTIDNFEIARQGTRICAGCSSAAINAGANDTISNMYIHDWATADCVNSDATSPAYEDGAIHSGYSYGIVLDHSTIHDVGGYAICGGVKKFFSYGGSCVNCGEVKNSLFHDTMGACFSVGSCHDSEFYNIGSVAQDAACNPGGSGCHSQVIEDDFGGIKGELVYNNYIHDNPNAGEIIGTNYSAIIFNNVMFNNTHQNILLDSRNMPTTGLTGLIYNNTIDYSANGGGIRSLGTIGGILIIRNNIFIPGLNGNPFSLSGSGLTITEDHNEIMSLTEASTYGFTSGRKYVPSSSDPNVVGQGVNLFSVATGSLAALAYDAAGAAWFGGTYTARPTATPWGLGTFQVGAQSASNPSPPSNLVATVQ